MGETVCETHPAATLFTSLVSFVSWGKRCLHLLCPSFCGRDVVRVSCGLRFVWQTSSRGRCESTRKKQHESPSASVGSLSSRELYLVIISGNGCPLCVCLLRCSHLRVLTCVCPTCSNIGHYLLIDNVLRDPTRIFLQYDMLCKSRAIQIVQIPPGKNML